LVNALPRQARDKRRENSKKDPGSQVSPTTVALIAEEIAATGEKTPLFGRFYTKNELFTKTGSGRT
jgi:hypothetical protein